MRIPPCLVFGDVRRGLSSYVERMRLFDHWQLHDQALVSEFPRSQFLLMVDKRPLVRRRGNDLSLVVTHHSDLKSKLADYGLQVDLTNSCLVDIMPNTSDGALPAALFGTTVQTATPPEDSPISIDDIRNELGKTLDGRFIDLRSAMLTLKDDVERNWLARMQTLSRWAHIYRRCPQCAAQLKMRISKAGAECLQCRRVYYPTYSPVTICLVTDPTDEHCILVRHRGSAGGVFTCIAGFAMTGEPLATTCKREVAEEVGIECESVRQLPFTQPWPMPDSSLMVAFHAIADMNTEINIAPDELESARWFSRAEVAEALASTNADPFLKGISREPSQRQILKYIPPSGAIAYHIIRRWVYRQL